ncbi:acetyl-CoA hydrolase/transferase family protein [Methanocalculus sp.]|uniref:acetyl-CoA hydrolase/transferase family protein n=1 Tax=Methanocalculus sp. TaxID=2004547 RepID=UPI0027253988|nr:acetyl-CoA hydrolase/transferase C-terminal domain-containing protein [Methanocalculus sp.]MDO8842290.1 acetyl-CoA hydrolase/transferase C-terminal domain-containing protein [Methanocalculus sp.]
MLSVNPHSDSRYLSLLRSPDEAVSHIKSGETIVYGMNICQPPALLGAIADHVSAHKLKDVNIYTFLPREHAQSTVLSPNLCDQITHHSWFTGEADRMMTRYGLSYHVPSYLHQIPRLCRDFMEIDTVVTTVSPMDKSGFFSFGTGNDYISTATRYGKKVILEVNQNMPRVFGDSQIHISDIDGIVECNMPLLELVSPGEKPEDAIIGPMIAGMIPDEATIQLGIGGLPNAVTRSLINHSNLGIHTELFTEGMVNLIDKGVITGKKKNLHQHKHIFTTAAGTKHMYDFMNDNPSIESYPASYVCSPAVIAKNDTMISINSILEVDLLGQANAEYLSGSLFSGTGGQLDFVRGAFDSQGGRSILAFYSTAKGGTISKIVPRLKEGSAITTPRQDIHYLVTEYGITNMKGKDTRQRALAIIDLAHPSFRDALLREADMMGII